MSWARLLKRVFERVDFGDFRLDRVRRRVWHKDGTRVAVSARLFDALLFFVEHAGQLLDKDQLMAALWPGQVVEENNLNQMVLGLRRALGDDGGENRYILTVPRRGFRFVADVWQVRPADPATGGDAVVHVVSSVDSPNDTRPPPPSPAPATGAAGPPTPARRGAAFVSSPKCGRCTRPIRPPAVMAMAWRPPCCLRTRLATPGRRPLRPRRQCPAPVHRHRVAEARSWPEPALSPRPRVP